MSIRTSIRLITAPNQEPVTLNEFKEWAKIDSNAEDSLITGIITTARESAERYMRRSIMTQTRSLTIDMPRSTLDNMLGDGVYDLPVTALYGDVPKSIELPYGDVRSITSVVTFDTANAQNTYAASNYFLDAGSSRLVLNDTAAWPSNMREKASITITYVAGYATINEVPRSIKSAILMHAMQMYDERTLCEMTENCKNLLGNYRKYGENLL